jgi:hypothetical protein
MDLFLKKFHGLCNNILCTVTFIKVKESEEIIGGYNPLKWKTSDGEWYETRDSFIFSFKSKNNFKDPILSHVKNPSYALFYGSTFGPTFGDDINIYVDEDDDSKEYDCCLCLPDCYEKDVRNTRDDFSVYKEKYLLHI